mmetsp:Transcript_70572/g.222937  ORF Transcript_70572/g.222937 Transcript_70572/m.222937 type:complete len:115 (+) Transcript_70572:68-412(+)
MSDCFSGVACASCGSRRREAVVPAIKTSGEDNIVEPEGEDGCKAVLKPAEEKDAPRSMAARLSSSMRSLSKRLFGKKDPEGAAAEALEATTAPPAPVAAAETEEKKEEQKEAAS